MTFDDAHKSKFNGESVSYCYWKARNTYFEKRNASVEKYGVWLINKSALKL